MTSKAPKLGPAQPRSRKASVIEEIKRAIVVGAVLPGQRLTELELSSTLQVSRPTIREALSQLTREGLLVQEPYKGIRVADVSPDDVMEIAALREALDIMAVTKVYADKTGSGMRRIELAWREFESLESHPDALVRYQAHMAFHHSIWDAADSPTLMRISPVVVGMLTVSLARDQSVRQDPSREHRVHEVYVQGILSGKMSEARKSIHDHTIGTATELAGLLREHRGNSDGAND